MDESNPFTLESVRRLFARIRADGTFDLADTLLWGYFFTGPTAAALGPVAEWLEALGYRRVKIYLTDDGSTWFLHVERVERHTAESLHARNQELYALAESFGLRSYDGWDVGPVISAPGAVRP